MLVLNVVPGEFVKGIGANANCENPLAGIESCENGLLYNDSDSLTVPVLKCYNFLEGNIKTTAAGHTIIEELSCEDEVSVITEIQWDSDAKKFNVICTPTASLPSGGGVTNSPVAGGWSVWKPANCAYRTNFGLVIIHHLEMVVRPALVKHLNLAKHQHQHHQHPPTQTPPPTTQTPQTPPPTRCSGLGHSWSCPITPGYNQPII